MGYDKPCDLRDIGQGAQSDKDIALRLKCGVSRPSTENGPLLAQIDQAIIDYYYRQSLILRRHVYLVVLGRSTRTLEHRLVFQECSILGTDKYESLYERGCASSCNVH